MKPVSALLAASLIQLAVLPLAHAQVSARASISNITVTLTDLAPDDGIAPSYTYWDYNPHWFEKLSTDIRYGAARGDTGESVSASTSQPWDGVQLDFDSDALPGYQGARLAAATRGSGTSLETLELSAFSSTQGAGSSWVDSQLRSLVYDMLLSPRTSLKLTMDVDLQATLDPRPSLWDNGRASALVWTEFSALVNEPNRTQYNQRRYTLEGPWTHGQAGPHTITIEYVNTYDTAVNTQLELSLYADSLAPLNPVPEPSAYAMLVAGLGLIGLLARRRTGS